MSEVEKQIDELVNTSGKQAPVISSALKSIGDGSMQDGIKKMADYYHNSGCVAGTQKGIIIGEKSGIIIGEQSGIIIGEKGGIIKGIFGGFSLAIILFGVILIYQENKKKKSVNQLDKDNEREGEEILKELRSNVPDPKEAKRVNLPKIERSEALTDEHSDDISLGYQCDLAE